MLFASWQRQKQPAQNFEIVRCLFVNGFEGSVLSSQDVSEMNQPRIHGLTGMMELNINL